MSVLFTPILQFSCFAGWPLFSTFFFLGYFLTSWYGILVETEIIRMNLRNGKTLRSDNLFKFPDLSLAFLFFSLKFPDYFSPSSISLTFPDFQDSGHSALVINPPVFAFCNLRVNLTLVYIGRGGANLPPDSCFATVQKRLALDCWNFVTFIVSLLHIIWYTSWSPGT